MASELPKPRSGQWNESGTSSLFTRGMFYTGPCWCLVPPFKKLTEMGHIKIVISCRYCPTLGESKKESYEMPRGEPRVESLACGPQCSLLALSLTQGMHSKRTETPDRSMTKEASERISWISLNSPLLFPTVGATGQMSILLYFLMSIPLRSHPAVHETATAFPSTKKIALQYKAGKTFTSNPIFKYNA